MFDTALIGFFNAIAALGYVYVATYIQKLRDTDCPCARSWKQDFMFGFSIVFTVICAIITYMVSSGSYSRLSKKIPHFEYIIGAATCVYILVSYSYVSYMNTSDCRCAQNVQIMLIYIIHALNGLFVTYGISFFIVLGAAYWLLKKAAS